MKALHFHGIFMFALRWHQAESVMPFVAAELLFFFIKYDTYCIHILTG